MNFLSQLYVIWIFQSLFTRLFVKKEGVGCPKDLPAIKMKLESILSLKDGARNVPEPVVELLGFVIAKLP